jgi:enoyl-CoA hydratase
MTSPTVTVETHEGVATVTLNRPDAMNALSFELRAALADTFTALQADDDVRVVVLTGAGRAFTAGLDLKELSEKREGDGQQGRDSVRAMERFEGPIIGAINGHAITGGFEIALACDLMIASSNAVFADTHVRMGVMPGWGLSQKLSRLVGIGRAKEISLTGNFVSAERAAEIGLVTRVVAPESLMETCLKLARDMASCEPEMLYCYKRLIDDGYATTFADALKLERANTFGRLADKDPQEIGERRKSVTSRGRDQVG